MTHLLSGTHFALCMLSNPWPFNDFLEQRSQRSYSCYSILDLCRNPWTSEGGTRGGIGPLDFESWYFVINLV